VNATVAERGGRARAIRNQGPRETQHRRSQTNPRAPHQQIPGPQATAARRARATSQGDAARRSNTAGPTESALQPGARPRRAVRHQPASGGAVGPQPGAGPDVSPVPTARALRPAHLRLVADHGRLVQPVFESVPVIRGGGTVSNEGSGRPGRRDQGARRVAASRDGQRARGRRAPARREGQRTATPRGPARRAAARPEHPAEGGQGNAGGPGRLRLTRRGRLLMTSTIIVLIAVASMVLASTADAAVHL
jgi:hypothetical protein